MIVASLDFSKSGCSTRKRNKVTWEGRKGEGNPIFIAGGIPGGSWLVPSLARGSVSPPAPPPSAPDQLGLGGPAPRAAAANGRPGAARVHLRLREHLSGREEPTKPVGAAGARRCSSRPARPVLPLAASARHDTGLRQVSEPGGGRSTASGPTGAAAPPGGCGERGSPPGGRAGAAALSGPPPSLLSLGGVPGGCGGAVRTAGGAGAEPRGGAGGAAGRPRRHPAPRGERRGWAGFETRHPQRGVGPPPAPPGRALNAGGGGGGRAVGRSCRAEGAGLSPRAAARRPQPPPWISTRRIPPARWTSAGKGGSRPARLRRHRSSRSWVLKELN